MNGWECCRRLKDEWQTSHVPVMMLTACTLDDQRVVSFDCGADAYIAKPFSPDMFRARLRNLIANRKDLDRGWFQVSWMYPMVKDFGVNAKWLMLGAGKMFEE